MPLPWAASSVAAANSSRAAMITARDMMVSSNVISGDDTAQRGRLRQRRAGSRQFGFDCIYLGLAPHAARGADRHDIEKSRRPRRQQEQAVTQADGIVDIVGYQQRRHHAAVYQSRDLVTQPCRQGVIK